MDSTREGKELDMNRLQCKSYYRLFLEAKGYDPMVAMDKAHEKFKHYSNGQCRVFLDMVIRHTNPAILN